MLGLTYDEQMEWRENLTRELSVRTNKSVKLYHPPRYYTYDFQRHKTEKEVMKWDLEHLKLCQIMVVNLNGIKDSIGTIYEIATANAVNSLCDKHIYILAFGDDNNLHPWIKESIFRYEESIEKIAEYIAEYLLV